MKMTNVTVNVN